MKAKDVREKSNLELDQELDKLKKELSDLRFKKVLSVVENPLKLRTIKKDIARIKTILHSRMIEKLKAQI